MGARSGQPRVCGPYGEWWWWFDADGEFSRHVRLSPAGRAVAAAWFAEWGTGERLLRHRFPDIYHRCRALGLSPAEVRSAADEGVVRGIIRYVPGRGTVLSTVVTWGVRGAVSDLVRRSAPHVAHERTGGHPGGYETDPAAPDGTDPDAAEAARRLLDAAGLTARERAAVMARFNGDSFAEVAGRLGLTKQRCQQIQQQGMAKVWKAAAREGVACGH